MRREIRLKATEFEEDTREKISELCSRLSEVPFNNWVYRGKKSVHEKSGEEIEEGTFSLRQHQVFYILSKSHKESRSCRIGADAVFGDGGDYVWEHSFCYSLKFSPQRQDTILVEEYKYQKGSIVPLYNKLDGERIRLEREKIEEIEEQKGKKRAQMEERSQRIGEKILVNLLRRK